NPRPRISRMVLAHNGDQPGIFDKEGKLFPTAEFFPANLINTVQPFNLIVTPIVFGSYQFGYFVCDYRESSPLAYKTFWPQLASCLRGIYLFEQRIKAEESLQQQKEELARSNGELQQFANIVSHDLQEPLRKILAFGERLLNLKDGISPQSRDYLERIHNATTRMQVLINDLLDYSRVTTKAQPFSKVKLGEIVRDVLADLEVKITEKQAEIELGDLPEMLADTLQMRQLFQNLIGNALKFTKPGNSPLIRIYSLFSDKDWMRLVVEDNGIGIEKEYYDRIFQIFERLHTRNEYEGTGIGLAICKKIVDRHGGTIQVESTVGVGTKFIVCLPVNRLLANQ
ncbi:MAG TPA: ATP-binding protein, partial [Bacillota bacterium]|nr:ATP-binding protein [Bacillota bacterium]